MSDEENGFGPTGEFPKGKIAPDDNGGLRFGITAIQEKNVIVFQFGKPVSWFALYPDDIKVLIKALTEKLRELEVN